MDCYYNVIIYSHTVKTILEAYSMANHYNNKRVVLAGAGRALSSAAPALASAAETLAALYHHVCAVNGTQPERVLLDHAGQTDGMCEFSSFYFK